MVTASPPSTKLWEIPGVRNFLTSAALSITGISLMLTVLFKQAFDITGDPLTIGVIGLLQFIPALLLVIVSGYIADRFDRRHITALCTAGRVGCAIVLILYSRSVGQDPESGTSVWPIYVVAFAFGTFDAIAFPTRQAIAPLVVTRDLLPKLIAAGVSTRMMSVIAGPVAAGVLYSVGADLAYGVVAALFVASIPPILRTQYAVAPSRLTDRPSFKLAMEGIHFIRRSPIVFSAIALDMFAVLFGGAVALVPVIAEEQLGVGNIAYGWLAASPGIGAVLTGFVLAAKPVTRRVGPTLLIVVAAFGLFHVTLGFTNNYAVAFASLALASAADMVSMTIRATLTPMATPDAQLGRVSAVESVFIGASNELGAFESGVAARAFGAPLAIAGGGVITIAIAGVFAAAVPALRNIDTWDDVTQGLDNAPS